MPAGGRAADGGALRSLSLPFEEVPEAEFPVLVEEAGRPGLPRFSYDELTGLPNRRSYTRALGEETERARRYGTDLALIWLDVQGLREFNHEHGTLQGDHILAQVAALLHAMVGTQGRLFRFAGPEFVVLFPGANQPTACRLAGALLEGVRKCTVRLLESSRTVRPTMSAGVAVFPQGLADPDNLQEAARRAVQRARREGRNRLAVHGSERDAAGAEAHLAGTFPCPLLVGRTGVLEEILVDLSRVGSPGTAPWTPPVVLVKGPLGVGSTRMLAEVAERCRQKGFRILRSEARAATVGQPFATLIRGLEDLLDREPGLRSRLRAGLTELELMALGRLSPMLCSGTPASEPVEVPLRPAFVRMLEALCREGPLLVLLDDAHRVERTSWQVLHHLWSGKQPGMSICAAADPTDPEAPPEAEGHPLREFLEEIRALQGVREFHLEPLTPVHVRAMLEAILPIPPRDVLVAEVYRRSRGLPLLVQETLKDLLHARQTAPVAGLQPRIEGLDEVSRKLLARAAVLGTQFHLETLLAVEDLDEGFLRGLLDRACGLELLEERDLGESFRFTSEHLRRDLEQSLPEQERRAIHLEIVRVHREACSLRPDGALSELAYHLRRAHDLAGARRVELQLAELHRRVSGTGEIVRGRPAEASQAPGPDHPLSPAEWALVMEIVRLLRMLVKGVRFYGVGHPQVGGTQTELLRVLAQFHRTRSRLDFSEARGVLIINGHPPDAAARRIGRLDLGPSWNLQSLSFVPGVNLSELRALTEALALSPDELKAQAGMAAMLGERGVSHVIPNDRLFVEVGERDVLMRRITDDGLVLVRPSQSPEEGTPSADLAPGSADGQTAEVPVAELASLMAAREEVAAWYEEMSRYLDLSFVEELSEDWDVLVADLESGNRIKVTAAAKAFLERGEDSIQPLTQLLARSPDARARKVALHLLQRLDDEVVPHLLSAVHRSSSEEERPRLLACLESFEAPAVGETLVAFLSHPSRQVRQAAMRTLEKRDPQALQTELARLLAQKNAPVEVLLDCLAAVGENQFRELLPRVLQFCRSAAPLFTDPDPRLQARACTTLGQLQERDGLQALLRCLSQRFSLYRARSLEARCAAALALAHFPVLGNDAPRVERALTRAAQDSEAAVRAAARLALARMQARQGSLSSDLIETRAPGTLEDTLLEPLLPAVPAGPSAPDLEQELETLDWEASGTSTPVSTEPGDLPGDLDFQTLLGWGGAAPLPPGPTGEAVAWADGTWPGLVPDPEPSTPREVQP